MDDENKTMGMNRLLTILSEGEDEMRRLSSHLNEQLRADAMNVQSRFSQAIAIVSSMEATGIHQMPSQGHTAASGSPGGSFSGSPSEGSERIVKKRKGTVKRTISVQGTIPDDGQPDTALVPDDGFSWRKYGQKSILNAKHPRSYYRCTFQKNQNCEALKQVQRSDEDPSIFAVTYQGEHTCNQQVGKTQSLEHQLLIPMQNESDEHVIINFNNSNIPIGTHESVHDDQSKIVSPSFSISSTQAGLRSDRYNVFSPSSSFGGAFSSGGGFSSGFVSSGASDSNYLSVFQSQFGADFGGGSSFHGSESELNDVISVPHSSISAANDFTVEQPPFQFDSPDLFK